MAMNNSDWVHVEEQLLKLYADVDLDCDGYRLSLGLKRIDNYKLAITFFVNGWFKGKWALEDCEERRRFFRPVTQRAYKRGSFKGISKSTLRSLNIDPDKKQTYYSAHWNSFGPLRRHLIKHNQSITLIPEKFDDVIPALGCKEPAKESTNE